MHNNRIEEVSWWYSQLSGHLNTFQSHPTKATKDELLGVMAEFKKAVDAGLKVPREVPAPLKEARTYGEWYHRLLSEGMAMFRINPNDDRMAAMQDYLQGYLDAVAMGRVKP